MIAKRAIALTVNGKQCEGLVEPRLSLADFLRDYLGLTGTHLGCEQGICGSCTVLFNGETVRSCLLLAVQANGGEILTVEGLAGLAKDGEPLHPIQQGFLETVGFQCGFCTPGFLLTVYELLNENSSPTEAEIREHLSGNLCRCTGYQNIVAAVLWAAERLQGKVGSVMASILRLKDIGKVWHIERTKEQVVALGGISMDVEQGEFLVFVGPSGCGKSTLLQIIAGLEKPGSGTVDLSRSADGQKQTGMVFQEFALFPWRTVLENIVFGPEVRSVPRAQREANAQKLIELVHLRGFEHRYPHELSGGMRQRVALARALANDPAILLFDEPLASLDAQTRKVLQVELVRIWQETKRTFIYVTHGLDEAVLLGDRVVLFTARPGRIKEIVPVRLPRPRSITGRGEVELLEYLSEQIREEVERSLKAEGLT